MNTKKSTKQLNERIKNKNTLVRVRKEQERSAVSVYLSDKNPEIEKKKENGYHMSMTGLIFAATGTFMHLSYSAVFPSIDSLQGNDGVFDFLVSGGIALTAFVAHVRMKKSYPRILRAFDFNRNSLFEIFKNYESEEISENLKRALLATDSNIEDQNEIVYLFTEHFCNVLEVSEISRMIDIYSTSMITPEVAETIEKRKNEVIENLVNDPRYLEIINKYEMSKIYKIGNSTQKLEYNVFEVLETV